MSMKRVMCAGGILTLLLASSVTAQVRRDTVRHELPVIRVGELVVQATRPVATLGGASALEVQLDSLKQRPAPTLETVLRELPFVQVRTNPRGEGYFAIRGSGFDAREVAVLVDGIPLSLGFDGRADLSVLPATGAQTLTLIRGLPALLYGPNVLGGVVDVGITRSGSVAETARAVQFNAGVDHTGARAFSGAVTLPYQAGSGSLLVHAGGGYRDSDGSPLASGVQEPAGFGDGELRLNSDHQNRDGFLAARYDAAGGAWTAFSASGFSAKRGTPAELNTGNPRFWRYPRVERLFGVLSAGTGERASLLGGRGELEASVGYDQGRTELDGFTTRAYATIRDQEDDDDRTMTVRLLGRQTVGSRGDVRTAFTYADVQRDEVLTPGAANEYAQRLWSAAAETSWRIASGVRLSGGVAYDGSDTPRSGDKAPVEPLDTWGGRIGVTSAAAGGRLLLHAGAGRRVRFPALRELYSGMLNRFIPNPDLGPEVLVAAEAGATAQIGRAQVQAVAFHHEIDDAIVREAGTQMRVKRVNRDQLRSTGLELLGSTRVGGLSLSADLTAQYVEVTDPNAGQELQPEYQPKFAGGARIVAPLLLATRLDVSSRMVGSMYCVDPAGGYDRVAASSRIDLELSRRWTVRPRSTGFLSTIDTGVALDNAADSAIYDQCGLPQPGRIVRFRVRIR